MGGIKRLDHVGIVVDDLDEAKRFVGGILGLQLIREREVPERKRRTASYQCGDVEIELIVDLDPEQKERSLDGAPARIEHVGLDVGDMEATIASLAAAGVRMRGAPLQRGSRLNAWTDPATTDGVVYQISGELHGTD